MKRYYCFFLEKGEFSPETKVFKVAVGSGTRDLCHAKLVENYAADLGFFFRPWDDVTEHELILRSKRYVSDCGRVGISYQIITLTMSNFYRHLIDDDLLNVPQSPTFIHNLHKLYSAVSPKFFAAQNRFLKYYFAPTFSRKHLSDKVRTENRNSLILLALLFALFLLQGWLDGLEMHMLYD